MKTNYQRELETAIDLSRRVRREILPLYYGTFHTRLKNDNSPVTEADLRANKIIVEGLQRRFPNDGIISEEMGDISGGRIWYVDPIDGTRGFVNHTDHFAVHIGLVEENSPVLGLVYKPTTGEYYSAIKDQGAFRQSKGIETRLTVEGSSRLGDGLVVTGNNQFITTEPGKSIYQKLNPSRFINMGSGGLRFAKIAENIADVHISIQGKANSWDICAPQIVVEEAGGIVGTLEGKPVTYHGQHRMNNYIIVAKNQELWDLAADAVKATLTQT